MVHVVNTRQCGSLVWMTSRVFPTQKHLYTQILLIPYNFTFSMTLHVELLYKCHVVPTAIPVNTAWNMEYWLFNIQCYLTLSNHWTLDTHAMETVELFFLYRISNAFIAHLDDIYKTITCINRNTSWYSCPCMDWTYSCLTNRTWQNEMSLVALGH